MSGAILVGYDGTDGAQAAVREAIRLSPLLDAAPRCCTGSRDRPVLVVRG